MLITINMIEQGNEPWVVHNVVEVIVTQASLEFKIAGGKASIPLVSISSAVVVLDA